MAVYGLDIAEVRSLAGVLATKADEINQIIATVTGKLNSTQWMGPDADNFRNSWNDQLLVNLHKVVSELGTASQNATINAQQQETASTS